MFDIGRLIGVPAVRLIPVIKELEVAGLVKKV